MPTRKRLVWLSLLYYIPASYFCHEGDSMATGKVKWFNDQKGFGFIVDEQQRDIFVHHTIILGDGFRTLQEGETVEYEAESSPKGLKATQVRRLAAVSVK
jgi:cold shock protein